MGHERIGFLPRTKKWAEIVDKLASYDGDVDLVKQIADNTLSALQKKYLAMALDESVIKALSFLATLSYSAKQENQADYLNANGYSVDSALSLHSLISSAQNLVATENGSLEVNKIARDAALQAVVEFQREHSSSQFSFFGENQNNVWESAGTGAAFCELARSFFAAFTERQLKYYLEREAANSIGDYVKLELFIKQLSEHTNAISDHSFDISKITQSFAAGWYNKNAASALPDEEQIKGFLNHSFGKLREEFRREGEDK